MSERDVRSIVSTVARGFAELSLDRSLARPNGPLHWPGYDESLSRARERTGKTESVVCGRGKIGDVEAVIIAFDFRFLGGSMGSVTGSLITQAISHAVATESPVVSL